MSEFSPGKRDPIDAFKLDNNSIISFAKWKICHKLNLYSTHISSAIFTRLFIVTAVTVNTLLTVDVSCCMHLCTPYVPIVEHFSLYFSICKCLLQLLMHYTYIPIPQVCKIFFKTYTNLPNILKFHGLEMHMYKLTLEHEPYISCYGFAVWGLPNFAL